MQLDLIDEEYHEFRNAFYNEPYENELKELADLVYVCFQYAENMEWDLEEALDRVHKSNMSKLGLDGTPIRRSDGKVLKGPNYQPPILNDLINPGPHLIFLARDVSNLGSMTQRPAYRFRAPCSSLKTQLPETMALKHPGNLYHTLYDMEQAARYTCRNCDPKEQKMTKGWLHLDRYLLPKSIQR